MDAGEGRWDNGRCTLDEFGYAAALGNEGCGAGGIVILFFSMQRRLIVGRLMETLNKNGLLTTEEGANIYRQAISGMNEADATEARRIMSAMLPDIRM
jgi:nucleoside 2-deoxyribosyltransferase